MAIKILCNVKKQNNLPGSFLAISFTDKFNEEKILLLPTKLLISPKGLKEWFIDHHFDLPSDDEWNGIIELLKQKTDKTGEIVDRTGIHGASYLLPDETIIGPQEKHTLFLDPANAVYPPNHGTSGSLEQWKENVAPAALHSSRVMLAIGNAISGYLLFLINVESGGFHIFGKSSMGKTTTGGTMVSFSGPRDNMQSWNFTEVGAEDLAYGHNDNCLALDELKTLDKDPIKATQKATKLIHVISSGKGKSKAKTYETNRKSWRVTLLSTGEHSLVKHAQLGGSDLMLGEKVRVVDIPGDAGKGMGIFETIPEAFKDSGTYVKYLDEQSQQYYGTPQIAFPEKFIADLNDDNAEVPVKDRIKNYMKKFRDGHEISAKREGVANRIGDRFALAYAAARLAAEYGVLPFSKKQIFNRISICFKASLDVQPETLEELCIKFSKKFVKYLESTEFPTLHSKSSLSKDEIEGADGFGCTIKDIKVIALKRDALIKLNLIAEPRMDEILKEHQSKGYLLPDAGGSNTRSITLNGKKDRRLCFVWPRDKNNIGAAKKLIEGYSKTSKK